MYRHVSRPNIYHVLATYTCPETLELRLPGCLPPAEIRVLKKMLHRLVLKPQNCSKSTSQIMLFGLPLTHPNGVRSPWTRFCCAFWCPPSYRQTLQDIRTSFCTSSSPCFLRLLVGSSCTYAFPATLQIRFQSSPGRGAFL